MFKFQLTAVQIASVHIATDQTTTILIAAVQTTIVQIATV
jgi:hypothetical protein